MINIKLDSLKNLELRRLVREHYQEMLHYSPKESVHAIDLSSLNSGNILYWTAWINDEIAGCGALNHLNSKQAEIKSMRTSDKFLRKGVAGEILTQIISYAKTQSYQKISLETGIAQVFVPAQMLYKNFGFVPCGPFANYTDDPFSQFFSLTI